MRQPSPVRDEIVRLYNSGRKYREIAEELNISMASISLRLQIARKLGQVTIPKRHNGKPVKRRRVVEMVQAGRSVEDIATELGMKKDCVRAHMSDARFMGELPDDSRIDKRDRDEDGNVLGRVALSNEHCGACGLRGEHVCKPDLVWYATGRREAA